MELKLELINKVLSNIEHPEDRSTGLVRLNQERTHTGVSNAHDGYGNQGEFNEDTIYYKHPEFPGNTFLKLVYRTNSYGEGSALHSIQFVKGVAKQVTVYEPI